MSKLEQLESIAATVRDRHGPESIVIMGQDHVFHVPAISTGVLPLDIAIGIGGFPRGRIVEIYGTESSGKSTICLAVMAACQQMGEPAALVDSENTFDPVWADKIGVKVGELLVSQPDSGEEGLGILETLVRTGEVGVVCIDSVAALVPQAELEGDIGDAHVGRQARLMSQALRMLTSVIRKSNCVVIFTNQIREKIGIMFGSPNTTPGGRALRFYASVRVETKRRSYITAGSGKDAPKIGINVGCNIVKNKVAPPFKNTECELYFDRGFDVGANVLAAAVSHGVVSKRGSWFSYGEDQLGQGKDKSAETLNADEDLLNRIREEVTEKALLKTVELEEEEDDNEEYEELVAMKEEYEELIEKTDKVKKKEKYQKKLNEVNEKLEEYE